MLFVTQDTIYFSVIARPVLIGCGNLIHLFPNLYIFELYIQHINIR